MVAELEISRACEKNLLRPSGSGEYWLRGAHSGLDVLCISSDRHLGPTGLDKLDPGLRILHRTLLDSPLVRRNGPDNSRNLSLRQISVQSEGKFCSSRFLSRPVCSDCFLESYKISPRNP